MAEKMAGLARHWRAILARYVFGQDDEVYDAIFYHTTGRANMSLAGKILYIADYIEPNRDFPGVEQLRALAFSDLRGALKLGLEMTLDHLKDQGCDVSPASKAALDYMNRS